MGSQPEPFPLDPKEVHRKLKLAGELFEMALTIKAHQIHLRTPSLSEEQARKEAYELICKAASR